MESDWQPSFFNLEVFWFFIVYFTITNLSTVRCRQGAQPPDSTLYLVVLVLIIYILLLFQQVELLLEGLQGAEMCDTYRFHVERGYGTQYFTQVYFFINSFYLACDNGTLFKAVFWNSVNSLTWPCYSPSQNNVPLFACRRTLCQPNWRLLRRVVAKSAIWSDRRPVYWRRRSKIDCRSWRTSDWYVVALVLTFLSGCTLSSLMENFRVYI